VAECKALIWGDIDRSPPNAAAASVGALGAGVPALFGAAAAAAASGGRGVHSSTYRLNMSHFWSLNHCNLPACPLKGACFKLKSGRA
jgi:hypothetical protein